MKKRKFFQKFLIINKKSYPGNKITEILYYGGERGIWTRSKNEQLENLIKF